MVDQQSEVPRREWTAFGEDLAGPADFNYIVPSGRRLTEYEAVTCYTQPQQGGGGLQLAGDLVLRPDGRPIFDPESTRLRCEDWFAFRDPSQLWQRQYYLLQAKAESAIDLATEAAAFSGAFSRLDAKWLDGGLIGTVLPFGHMEYGLFRTLNCAARESLSDTLNSVLVFNAADKLRHAQAISILGFDVEQARPGFLAAEGRRRWMEDELWQPARRLVESAMAVSDWGEAIVAVNGAVEPLVCEPLRRLALSLAAARHGDMVTPVVASTAINDWRRNSRWTRAFFDFIVSAPEGEKNECLLAEWAEEWAALAEPVAAELLVGLEDRLGQPGLAGEGMEAARLELERAVGQLEGSVA